MRYRRVAYRYQLRIGPNRLFSRFDSLDRTVGDGSCLSLCRAVGDLAVVA